MTLICWCAIRPFHPLNRARTRRVVEALDQIELTRISHGDCGLNAPHSVVSTPENAPWTETGKMVTVLLPGGGLVEHQRTKPI
jgi:hypothetical protein